MGEYVRYLNDTWKVGSCSEAFYVRHVDIVELLAFGALSSVPNSVPVERYLEEGMFRWRLPVPREDDEEPFAYDDHIGAHEDVPIAALPEPLSEACMNQCQIDKWVLVGQVLRLDDLRLVVMCPKCRQTYSIDVHDATLVCGALCADEDKDRNELARRIMAGYGLRHYGSLRNLPDGAIAASDIVRVALAHWYVNEHQGPIDWREVQRVAEPA